MCAEAGQRWLLEEKSQWASLCGVLVFDGSLCYSISKVSVCVKVLLPLQQQQFPGLDEAWLMLLPHLKKQCLLFQTTLIEGV